MKPTKGRVTCKFGVKGPLWKGGIHKGIDYTGKEIYAAVPGIVVHSGSNWFTGWGKAFGIHVIIDNDKFADGSPGRWAGYMHMSKSVVKRGQHVKKGDLLGYVGSTGNVTGPHLHFEVQIGRGWNAKGYVNPKKWIDA